MDVQTVSRAEDKKVVRSSNIELLKIIAMFLICLSHCINPFNSVENSVSYQFTFNSVFGLLIKNVGWFGDFIFLTCSAYFLANTKKFNIKKVIHYYIGAALIFISYLIGFKIAKIPVDQKLFSSTITTMEVFDYWYIKYYLYYLLILPILNLLLDKLNQKQHKILMIIVLAVQEIWLILANLTDFGLTRLFIFINIHIVMKYGIKYGKFLIYKEDDKKKAGIGLLILLLYWIIKGTLLMFLGNKGIVIFESPFQATERESLLYIFFGVSIFILFKNIKMKTSKFINYISSLSLVFYLAHHNSYTSALFDGRFINLLNNTLTSLKPVVFLGYGIARFLFGVVVSIIYYHLVFKPLGKLINLIPDKINFELKIIDRK